MDFFPDHLNYIISILLKHRFGCTILYTFSVTKEKCNCLKEINNWSNNKRLGFFKTEASYNNFTIFFSKNYSLQFFLIYLCFGLESLMGNVNNLCF